MKIVIWVLILFFTACSNKDFKRVALVIGNQNYPKNRLKNPISDSVAIGKKLHDVGYKVIYKKDLNREGLKKALDALKKEIVPDDTILFIYYAGHAMIPMANSLDTHLSLVSNEKKEFYSIFKLYDKLTELNARHNIVAIDACQNYAKNYIINDKKINQKAKQIIRGQQHRFRASDYDFGEDMRNKLPRSIIISRATETNYKAYDISSYDKKHSPYARCMLKYLDRDDFIVENMFGAVRECVAKETHEEQISNEVNYIRGSVIIPKLKGSSSTGSVY